jgi:hypothetical protein
MKKWVLLISSSALVLALSVNVSASDLTNEQEKSLREKVYPRVAHPKVLGGANRDEVENACKKLLIQGNNESEVAEIMEVVTYHGKHNDVEKNDKLREAIAGFRRDLEANNVPLFKRRVLLKNFILNVDALAADDEAAKKAAAARLATVSQERVKEKARAMVLLGRYEKLEKTEQTALEAPKDDVVGARDAISTAAVTVDNIDDIDSSVQALKARNNALRDALADLDKNEAKKARLAARLTTVATERETALESAKGIKARYKALSTDRQISLNPLHDELEGVEGAVPVDPITSANVDAIDGFVQTLVTRTQIFTKAVEEEEGKAKAARLATVLNLIDPEDGISPVVDDDDDASHVKKSKELIDLGDLIDKQALEKALWYRLKKINIRARNQIDFYLDAYYYTVDDEEYYFDFKAVTGYCKKLAERTLEDIYGLYTEGMEGYENTELYEAQEEMYKTGHKAGLLSKALDGLNDGVEVVLIPIVKGAKKIKEMVIKPKKQSSLHTETPASDPEFEIERCKDTTRGSPNLLNLKTALYFKLKNQTFNLSREQVMYAQFLSNRLNILELLKVYSEDVKPEGSFHKKLHNIKRKADKAAAKKPMLRKTMDFAKRKSQVFGDLVSRRLSQSRSRTASMFSRSSRANNVMHSQVDDNSDTD